MFRLYRTPRGRAIEVGVVGERRRGSPCTGSTRRWEMTTRRQFLQHALGIGAGLALPSAVWERAACAATGGQVDPMTAGPLTAMGSRLKPFVQPLPVPDRKSVV